MSEREPRRLLHPGLEVDPNLRALLAAGRAELPNPEQVAALARRAGLQFVAPAAKSALAGAGIGSSLSLVTLSAVLVGLGAAAHFVVEQVRKEGAPEQRVSSAVDREAVSAGDPEALPVARTAEQRLAPEAATLARPGLEPPVRPAPPQHGRAANAGTDPVAELTLLDEAQGALRSTPAMALDRAAAHAVRFPHGQYEQEREIIAIEALLQLGRSSAAERRAARFIARFPGSSYRSRAEQQHARATENAVR